MADAPITGLPIAVTPNHKQPIALVESAETKQSTISDIFAGGLETVYIKQKSDFPAAVSGVITLEVKKYIITSDVDLGTDVISMVGGCLIVGSTATLSILRTASTSPLLSLVDAGFLATAIRGEGGLRLNNTGGPVLRVEGNGSFCFTSNLVTSAATTCIELHNSGGFSIDNWTIMNAVNGLVLTGTGSFGPFLRNFNPSGLSGKGVDIQGDISTGTFRCEGALITTEGTAYEISGTTQGVAFDGDAISTVSGNGMKISGNITGGIILEKTNILSYTTDGMDITGSTISNLIASAAGMTSLGAGFSGLKGDAASANITNAALISDSNIQGLGAGGVPLSGITKKDLKYKFTNAGPGIVDSADIGVFTLDSQSTTTINFQGFNGAITAYADAGGGSTTVTSAGHSVTNGAPVSITGTVAYNGIFTAANVTANTFDIVRTFVTDEATGNFESGWTKIDGATTAGASIERFDLPNDNELRLLDDKSLPLIYTASISGEKTGGTGRIYEFALFVDNQDGNGFVKTNGSVPREFTNRAGALSLRVVYEGASNKLSSTYIRNTEGTEDFICNALSVDILTS